VNGIPASVLFLANGANIEVVGYNEQWLAPASGMPFRYGGAVGNVDYPDDIKEAMAEAARKIVMATGLRGLNSMDFMLVSGTVLVLEVNPRLTASFGLYYIPDLIDRHLQACRGKLNPVAERLSGANAHLIYYASHTVDVTVATQWPEWTADLPPEGSRFQAGEPLCTVVAEGENSAAAKALVFARARQLDAQLNNLTKHPVKQ
jgi:predicted ATP-grasp superfamily ATP-dependent carboligase